MSDPTDAPSYDPTAVVTALLSVAQLTVSDEEREQMIKDYPLLRSGADALYLAELAPYEPAPKFSALEYYSA
jgi:hypothetical protein